MQRGKKKKKMKEALPTQGMRGSIKGDRLGLVDFIGDTEAKAGS